MYDTSAACSQGANVHSFQLAIIFNNPVLLLFESHCILPYLQQKNVFRLASSRMHFKNHVSLSYKRSAIVPCPCSLLSLEHPRKCRVVRRPLFYSAFLKTEKVTCYFQWRKILEDCECDISFPLLLNVSLIPTPVIQTNIVVLFMQICFSIL